MKNIISSFKLDLPFWSKKILREIPEQIPSDEEKMRLLFRFAKLNIDNNTGGPFSAGVFESETGKIVSIGVNRVMPCNCSSAHAEIMALSLAQQKLGTYDLGGQGLPKHDLFVNWLPCTMCFGALIWSGVTRLVIAGHGHEMEEITGFDEGPRPVDWKNELLKRNIDIVDNLLRDEAIEIFKFFKDNNQFVYNARQGLTK
jgi:tRNA(Arg) A34 adenosine deaminase TadA